MLLWQQRLLQLLVVVPLPWEVVVAKLHLDLDIVVHLFPYQVLLQVSLVDLVVQQVGEEEEVVVVVLLILVVVQEEEVLIVEVDVILLVIMILVTHWINH